jgi:hypothetical protein
VTATAKRFRLKTNLCSTNFVDNKEKKEHYQEEHINNPGEKLTETVIPSSKTKLVRGPYEIFSCCVICLLQAEKDWDKMPVHENRTGYQYS